MTYFGPALDPPLGRSGRKTTTLVRDLEHFIHTRFHQNLSSGSGEEVKNVNCLTDNMDNRRRTTDAGQRVWLLCPKNITTIPYHFISTLLNVNFDSDVTVANDVVRNT